MYVLGTLCIRGSVLHGILLTRTVILTVYSYLQEHADRLASPMGFSPASACEMQPALLFLSIFHSVYTFKCFLVVNRLPKKPIPIPNTRLTGSNT